MNIEDKKRIFEKLLEFDGRRSDLEAATDIFDFLLELKERERLFAMSTLYCMMVYRTPIFGDIRHVLDQ